MGISERRERERQQRQADILAAAWLVAERVGWATFSVEKVAAEAELGRATVYGYFESLEALVLALANKAFEDLSERIAAADKLTDALDVPVRFAKSRPACFALLFPPSNDPRAAFSNEALEGVRVEARQLLGRLQRLAARSRANLPEDARSAEAFLAAVSMAATLVPELTESTTLRHRWQDFVLGEPTDEPPDEGVEKGR